MTPLDQLRLRLPAHPFDRLMQAAKPVAEADRDALLKDIAAELGQHEVDAISAFAFPVFDLLRTGPAHVRRFARVSGDLVCACCRDL